MSAKAMGAEFIGTFALVTATCGAFMFAAPAGVGVLAPSLAAGFTMMALYATLAHVSGGHFNPAVTIGLITAGRFGSSNLIGYILAQVLGAAAAAITLQTVLANAVAGGPAGSAAWNSLAAVSNSYGGPRGFDMTAAFIIEIVATTLFVLVFIGATSKKALAATAPLAIGGALLVLHLLAFPVTNASLNPARSTATAVLAGGIPMSQLWVFWLAPIIGGILGGAIGKWLHED